MLLKALAAVNLLWIPGCQETSPPEQVREIEVKVDWASASVESNGISIHYWRTGQGDKPAMVMAHGITDYGLNWMPLARQFEADYDIVMYDARGHGYSDKPVEPYDLRSHADDLLGLIDGLKLEKPVLIGHSMGGGTVALAAALRPAMPRAVILEDPADMLVHLSPITDEVRSGWRARIKSDQSLGKPALMQLAKSERHPGWTDLQYNLWAESKLLVTPDVLGILEGAGFGNALETYAKITAPTLILKADAEPAERRRHVEIAKSLPQGRIVHIDGAGHVIRSDRPVETEKVIREFLASLAAQE